MEVGNGAAATLFASLLREIQGDGGDATDANQQPAALGGHTELRAWWESSATWRTAAEGGDKRDGYTRLYRRLVEMVRTTTRLAHLSDQEYASLVERCAQDDWAVDQEHLGSLELCSTSIAALALHAKQDAVVVMARLVAPEGSADAREAEAATPPLAPLTRGMTMAEKLSHMRSRRSMLVKEDSLSSKPVPTEPPRGAAANALAPLDGLVSRNSSSDGSNMGGPDEASRYFAIETRMELQETLRALQRRLDELLIQTKLAWMKCFAGSSMASGSCDEANTSESMQTATRLVTQGEALAALLMETFSKARTNGPIYEYKALVIKCGNEFDEFQALVLQVAAAPSPTRTEGLRIKTQKGEDEPRQEQQDDVQRRLAPPVFDLPSMKAHYEKAALPYAAYLSDKQSKHMSTRRRR